MPLAVLEDLRDNYEWFLWGFHRSQWNYRVRAQVTTPFDPIELRERTTSLQRILEENKTIIHGGMDL